jgi:protein-L-isoaspartate(D-aspartate) O-methyltransferase
MHAYCLEWLNDKLTNGAKVLDVGCGSGYLCAAFYEMTKNPNSQGRTSVVGIEHIEPLA